MYMNKEKRTAEAVDGEGREGEGGGVNSHIVYVLYTVYSIL